MRNSRVKNSRQTIAYLSPEYTNINSHQCPESYQLNSPTHQNLKRNNYDSNYNFFQTRINQEQKQQKKPERHVYHRYASMDNSRMSMMNFHHQQQPIVSSLSSPYLLHAQNLMKQNPFEQRTKMIAVNQNSLGLKSSQQPKCGKQKKLSMKNTFANNPEKNYSTKVTEEICSVQDSGISTQHDSIKSRKNAQELLKFLRSKMQKPLQSLKQQIVQQDKMIKTLNQKIESLITQLKYKQQQISNLKSFYSQQNCTNRTDTRKISGFQDGINDIQKLKFKIIKLQQYFQNKFHNNLNQQNQIQVKLNNKIDKVMQYVLKILQRKTQGNEQPKNQQSLKLLKQFMNKFNNSFIQNKDLAKQTREIGVIVKSIREECQLIKSIFQKTNIKNKEENINFADFSSFQEKTKKQSVDLNDSASYFFHPSELSNIDKITELFINRQGKPIQCYVDNQNQVKYRDTNTFMFNKKGDIVRLTESQKKYYIDKGFICGNK